MVSMVAEGREMAAFRLRICSSTEVLLERGLEGMLTDLRWHAILGIGESCETLKLLGVERRKIKGKLLQWCLLGFGFFDYIRRWMQLPADRENHSHV